jgi:hypothetical protein
MTVGEATSNIGLEGIDSIRIGGMKIEDLPLANAHDVKMQMPLVEDTIRQNKIEDLIAKYPKQSVAYLQSRMEECKLNIDQQTGFKGEMGLKIQDYQGKISMDGYRDTQLKTLDPDGSLCKLMGANGAERIRAKEQNREPVLTEVTEAQIAQYEQIKSVRRNFPPYDVVQMEAQIENFREAIDAADKIVKTEFESIAELNGVAALCIQRDNELRGLGVKIGQA